MTSSHISRRSLLLGGLGVAGAGALAACGATTPPAGTGREAPTGSVPIGGRSIGPAPSVSAAPGQRVVTAALTPKPTTLDLGGPTVSTWAYGDTAPGSAIRATAGDLLRITVHNQLPAETTVHWHGIRLRNAADGVPAVTQDPIKADATYRYEFTAPDPGTYFFHPHVGVQLDRGLYAPLIIDDPHEPGRYDAEWIVVLDDWIDGTGTTPDQVLQQLLAGTGPATSMGGMDHGSMSMEGMDDGSVGGAATSSTAGMGGMMGTPPWGDAGDVSYPHFLINGKAPTDPVTFTGKPGHRVRIRLINAGSDTIFTVALGGHRMTVTHTDGWPVQPTQTGALYIGMGERYDVIVTLDDGVFPLVAAPFGKTGQATAMVRTAPGAAPAAGVTPAELSGDVLIGSELKPAAASLLPDRTPDSTADLILGGQMQPYQWILNGAPYGQNTPLTVKAGQRLRIRISNMTMMSHPIHLHGHTFALADSGLRKDTVLLSPMQSRAVELDADNTGDWMLHCHNIYHAEAGMMILLNYTK